MNRRLMQESKSLAMTTIKNNIAKIIFIIIISSMPLVFCSGALMSLLPTFDVDTLTYELWMELYKTQMYGQVILWGISILFYPITISANKMFIEMSLGKEASIRNLFVNYSSISKVFSSLSLLISIAIKAIFRIFPCFILFVICGGVSVYISAMGFDIIAIPFLCVSMLAVIYYSIGRGMLVTLYQNICYLNFDNPEFSRRETYRKLKELYRKKTFGLSNLYLSFLFFNVIAAILASFTASISYFLFSAYFTIATTFYVTKHHTQFLPKNINSQEGYYGQ